MKRTLFKWLWLIVGLVLISVICLPIGHFYLFKSRIPANDPSFKWLVLKQPLEYLKPIYDVIAEVDQKAFTSNSPIVVRESHFEQMRVPKMKPHQVQRLLWQRSYPKQYQSLIQSANELRSAYEKDDPFSFPFTTPDKELTPSSFGVLSSWNRRLLSRAFTQLGHPTNWQDGVIAHWQSSTDIYTFVHSQEAIAAFKERFPEFKEVEN